MNGEDFEFYRDLEPSKLKEPKMEDFRYINLKNDDPFGLKKSGVTTESKDVLEFVPKKIEMVKKTKVKRKRRRTTIQIKSRRLKAFIIAAIMLAGYGVHSLVDFVKPYVRDYRQYESDRLVIAELFDRYRVTKEGNEKSFDLTYIKQGLFYDGPEEIDYDKSVTIENGKKSGPAVVYFDGLDSYVARRNGGKGYYETVYEMNELAERLPLIEPGNAGPYTPEELKNMLEEKEVKKEVTTSDNYDDPDPIATYSSLGGK